MRKLGESPRASNRWDHRPWIILTASTQPTTGAYAVGLESVISQNAGSRTTKSPFRWQNEGRPHAANIPCSEFIRSHDLNGDGRKSLPSVREPCD